MNLSLDFGNSRMKAAIFNERKVVRLEAHKTLTVKQIDSMIRRFHIDSSILASVIDEGKEMEQVLKRNTRFIKFDYSTPIPINNLYKTPKTLGSDRLANLVGAHSVFPRKNCLVISAGTCITYDVLTAQGDYFGGNITPGLDMRLKAMNTFTARLPFVKKKMTQDLFGKSTAASMLTGVVKGAALEMQGFISEYKNEYRPLKVILTGGDASFFETPVDHGISHGKSKTFAIPHLVLYGLNEILLLNNAKA